MAWLPCTGVVECEKKATSGSYLLPEVVVFQMSRD